VGGVTGAVAGDVIGSVHEATATKTKRFPLFVGDSGFTDDTVLTAAVADVLLAGGDYRRTFQRYYHGYPDAGYGGRFRTWAGLRRRTPYGSRGNGATMRVSPVAYTFDTLDAVLAEADRSAAVTHDHPEGVRGARAVAAAVFLARGRPPKDDIRGYVEAAFGYRLDVPLRRVRRTFLFDVSAPGTVPFALRAFLEADGYEDAVRNAVSLGGDADTLACIAGAVAGAYYGVPAEIEVEAFGRLDYRLRGVFARFRERFGAC
jgi:ADP-ribosylglycohydrolase